MMRRGTLRGNNLDGSVSNRDADLGLSGKKTYSIDHLRRNLHIMNIPVQLVSVYNLILIRSEWQLVAIDIE